MPDHEFPGGAPRCIYCGTLARETERKICPGPQVQHGEKLRPEPVRREFAVNDADVIHARLAELEAERVAVLNRPAETDAPTIAAPAIYDDTCYD